MFKGELKVTMSGDAELVGAFRDHRIIAPRIGDRETPTNSQAYFLAYTAEICQNDKQCGLPWWGAAHAPDGTHRRCVDMGPP